MKLNSLAVLYWLNEQSTQIEQTVPAEVCPEKYLPGVYNELSDLGLLIDDRRLSGSPTFTVKPEAVETVEDLASSYRPLAIRREVLREINEYPDRGGTDEYQDRITVLGGSPSEQELLLAVESLRSENLIKGIETAQTGKHLIRPELTTKGQNALRSRDVELSLPKMTKPSMPPISSGHPVINTYGDNVQIAWGNQSVNQSQQYTQEVTPGYEGIAQVIDRLLAHLPNFKLNEADTAEVEDNANVVLQEISREDPDGNLIKRGLTMIRGLLAPVITGAQQAVSAETQQKASEILNDLSNLPIGM